MKKNILLIVFVLLSIFSSFAQPKVIAHRGFWDIDNGAHNSLSSLYRTHEIGAYGVEFDVWMTGDGELVVFHDEYINGIHIATTSYNVIRDMHISNGEILPTLDNFLTFAKNFPELRLILEIKSNILGEEYAKKLAKAVVDKVESHKLDYRTDYIAFNLDVCKELAKYRANLHIEYLSGNESPKQLKEWGINGIDYNQNVLFKNPYLVKESHDSGLSVNVWTVNEPVNMRRLIGMGVDYITTDKPVLLQQVIKEYYTKYNTISYPEIDLNEFKKDKNGYYIIFDGTDFKGWRSYGLTSLSDKWVLDNGAMKMDSKKEGDGGDIIFSHLFDNFELDLEWKISEGGNSGIFYLIQEISELPAAASSPEVQILDNDNHQDSEKGKDGNRKAGSLYDLIPADPQNTKSYGEWNQITIRVVDGYVEHIQNGEKILEYNLWSQEWVDLLSESKFSVDKWTDAFYLMSSAGGKERKGYFGFQDHGNDVWFRNIRIKKIR